jgi:tetratricopeptide (TPR) repeat protein
MRKTRLLFTFLVLSLATYGQDAYEFTEINAAPIMKSNLFNMVKSNWSLTQCVMLFLFVILGCSPTRDTTSRTPVLTGLDGRLFYEPELTATAKARLDSNLAVAQATWDNDPSEDNYIWLGRRHAYRNHYHKAIEIFTEGLAKFPTSYKLYRHRGHRYITVRDFDKAIVDLQQAAAIMPPSPLEVEPDGIPNRLNTPLSSTQFNVWYHLALAHYLKGNFEKARQAYEHCLGTAVNDDLLCATADWLYMTLRRQGKRVEAEQVLTKISRNMKIIENDAYHKRLLLYKGLLPVDSVLKVREQNDDRDLALATQGYGVGNWYLYSGDTAQAEQVFRQVVEGKHFSSFGFISAEAELERLKSYRND